MRRRWRVVEKRVGEIDEQKNGRTLLNSLGSGMDLQLKTNGCGGRMKTKAAMRPTKDR